VSVPGDRASPSECIRLDGATVRFGRVQVLRAVSLTIDDGEFVCVRGGNGAGKTTLLRLVAGAIRPARGRREGPRSCAYVPAALAPPSMSVAGWIRGVRRDRVDDPWAALTALGFDGTTDRSCRELSFGNLRKVLLADALTSAAALVALDEMHAGLDHSGRVALDQLVTSARARGVVVVAAAQDDDAVDGTDRTWVVGDGQVHEGTLGEPGTVRRTLRGPLASEHELLAAAERLGFRPDDDDER
jgi:ABC-2 type transport system ATP-binding protein